MNKLSLPKNALNVAVASLNDNVQSLEGISKKKICTTSNQFYLILSLKNYSEGTHLYFRIYKL